MLLTSWVVADPRPVEPDVELQLHHGVYFRPLGEVMVTGSDWTVCTSINLQTYEDIHSSLVGQISQVDEHMRELESSNNYSDISSAVKLITSLGSMWKKLTTLLRQDLDEYLRNIDILKRVAIENETRPTRGLVNVVSNVGKYLFGFSTERDVRELASKIQTLESQAENLTHLSTNQFSYIKAVATQALHNGKQANRLQNAVQEMTKAIQALATTSANLQFSARFAQLGLEMLTAIEFIRESFSQSQGGLVTIQKIMAKAGEGRLAWELFEDPIFRELLLDLNTKLPRGWTLLYGAKDHFDYLHYIQVETHRTETGLNLCMAIPIVKTSGRYQLYEAVSMPVVHPEFPEKLFFSYNFQAPYLAIQKTGSDHFTPQAVSDLTFFTLDKHREATCVGVSPKVCSLREAVRTPSTEGDDCLYDLFTSKPSKNACPVQVQYQDGPVFRHVGLGVWLYGAARGTLYVNCSNQSDDSNSVSHYKLTGTGAFRLQPGCEAVFGPIKVPSYDNGKGQFKIDLPDAPIVNLFSLNFTRSLWSNVTSDLRKPENFTSFLIHLSENSDIQKNAMSLKTFNETIQRYQALQGQLPLYHPFVWATHPAGQVTGFTFLLLLNVISALVLAAGMWKLRRKMNEMAQYQTALPSESCQLTRSRRRRRQTSDHIV